MACYVRKIFGRDSIVIHVRGKPNITSKPLKAHTSLFVAYIREAMKAEGD
jgi:hypothetical protein